MDLFKLLKNLLSLEADTDLILQGKCPECGGEMPENEDYDGPDCYLCPDCRTGEETDETL